MLSQPGRETSKRGKQQFYPKICNKTNFAIPAQLRNSSKLQITLLDSQLFTKKYYFVPNMFWTIYSNRPIESTGRARWLDKILSGWASPYIQRPSHLLTEQTGKGPFTRQRIKAMIVKAVLNSLAPRYLKKKRAPTTGNKWSLLAILVENLLAVAKYTSSC